MTSNLSSFTDILGEEINDSQPISLPSSVTSECEPVTRTTLSTRGVRPPKHTGQHGDFRSKEEIDFKYRSIFTYPYFNLVQSSVLDDAIYSDKSMVVCAPTGSGKTVVFEMAIVQLLMELDDKQYTDDFKIIYMAPVKALCTERLSEWYPKFTKLGLLCIEVTGDTDVDFSQLKPYRIIITTPEKWDMLTRRWRDHKGLVEVIKLFLIDEVHILNDEIRGPVLEAVVSRMKTIESSVRSAHRIEQLQKQYRDKETSESDQRIPLGIRFVAVSATIGNPADVAAWLGSSEKPAVYYKFGDECRPVKLNRIVEGYPCSEGTSIFKFDIILNYKLWPIIQRYHNGKPTLIFCNTRKSVLLTAETLSREITVSFNPEQKAKLSALAATIKTKKLQTLVLNGVGCHHAGLLYEERITIEQAFRNRDLPILITTTTLAMGVNLPAHLVIIKNTQQYVNGAYQEYSISTVLQMVGRAGRPQFDTEATAVIMTRLKDRPRYQALVGGSEPLQSYLHKRLPENLNSEAALGTISDVAQCVQWLRSTFLSVRAASDPKRYLGLPPAAPAQLITKKLEELCVKAMNGLATAGLITMDEASCIESTEAGRLMSVFYLDLETMKFIMKVDGSENLERLLWLVCQSHELADMHLRIDERRTLNALNRNSAAATIRYSMKGKISSREMKLNCVIQAILGCLPIPDPSMNQEAMKIMRIAERVCKCLVTYVTQPELVNQQQKTFSAVLNSIILVKCITAHLWENSSYVSKQLKGIGPTFSTLLASAGKVNFMLLEESHPRDLERIMNKGPPAGNILRKQISLLPKYQVTMTPIDEMRVTVDLVLLNQVYLSENMENLTAGDKHKCYVVVGDSENHLLLLTCFKDRDLISMYDGKLTYQITRKHSIEHKILVNCVSSSFVGLDVQAEYVFEDLQPQFIRREVHREPYENVATKTTKQTTKRQTNITDTFKERKRRNVNDEITQSKEKKKRDSALIEKFRVLRESFGATSNEIRNNLQVSTNMTNKILKDIVQPDKCDPLSNMSKPRVPDYNITRPMEIVDIVELDLDDTFIDNTNTEKDFMDESRINSILSEIENEISNNNVHINDGIKPSTSTAGIMYQSKLPKESDNSYNIARSTHRNQGKSYNKKSVKKSNYAFLEKLENKIDNDDSPETSPKQTGFSEVIKCQIATFLQNSINKTPCVELTVQRLFGENNCSNSKENLSIFNENNNNEEILQKCDNNNKQESSFCDLPHVREQIVTEPKKYLDLNNTDEAIINCSSETIKLEDLETIKCINSGNKSYALEHARNEIIKNNFEMSTTKADSLERTKSIKYIDVCDTKYNAPEIPTTISNQVQINSINEIVPQQYRIVDNMKDNLNNLAVPLAIQNSPLHDTVHAAQTTISNRPSDFIKGSEYNDMNPNEITYYNADIIYPKKNAYEIFDLANSINNFKQSSQESSIWNIPNNDTYIGPRCHYVNKYSLSATKVDMCTKQKLDRRIQVIRRMKVDVDVTEIVTPTMSSYKMEDFNEPFMASCLSEINEKEGNNTAIKSNTIKKALGNHSIVTKSLSNDYNKVDKLNSEENTQNLLDLPMVYVNKEEINNDYNNESKNINITKDSAEKKTNMRPDNDNAVEIVKSDLPKNNRPSAVKNILSRYLNKLGKNKIDIECSHNTNQSLSRKSDVKSENPKRLYKICDIDKQNVPLPKTLLSEAPKFKQCLENTECDERPTFSKNTSVWESEPVNRKIEKDNISTNNKTPDYQLNDFDTECLSPEPVFETKECPISPIAESMLDQSMFNPKTLLQCFNNDGSEEEILPPPPQFCDSNINDQAYSPTHNFNNMYLPTESFDDKELIDLDEDMDGEYNHTNNSNSALDHHMSIFKNDSKIKLTPTKEIETWTFTCDDDSAQTRGANLLQNDLNKSWTILHKKSPRVSYTPSQHSFPNRQSRLGQFKFSRKK